MTGYGNAKALAKWVSSSGGGHDEDSGRAPDSTSRITTSTLYYDSINIRFGVHTSNPYTPLHVIGTSLFEGSSESGYNRLSLGTADSVIFDSTNMIGYLGFNIYRKDDGSWFRGGDGTNNGSSCIFGNTRGDIVFGNFVSTGGSIINSIADSTVLSGVNMILTDKGRLGLGTISPRGQMELIHDDKDKCGLILNQCSDTTMSTNEIQFHRNGSEKWAIGSYLNGNHPNSFFIWNDSINRTVFMINNDSLFGINTENPSAMLEVNGSFKAQTVGIGTNPPPADSSWKLYVEGGIMAREVRVTANTFPDYVFELDYYRLTVNELEDYIRTNKRLPGIPSAEEIETSGGINLGTMQVKLLEKIEEQALYIIDLQRQIDELKTFIKGGEEDNR